MHACGRVVALGPAAAAWAGGGGQNSPLRSPRSGAAIHPQMHCTKRRPKQPGSVGPHLARGQMHGWSVVGCRRPTAQPKCGFSLCAAHCSVAPGTASGHHEVPLGGADRRPAPGCGRSPPRSGLPPRPGAPPRQPPHLRVHRRSGVQSSCAATPLACLPPAGAAGLRAGRTGARAAARSHPSRPTNRCALQIKVQASGLSAEQEAFLARRAQEVGGSSQ